MNKKQIFNRHAELAEGLLGQFDGTPEEFGVLLETATHSGLSRSFLTEQDKIDSLSARRKILSMEGGWAGTTPIRKTNYEIERRSL